MTAADAGSLWPLAAILAMAAATALMRLGGYWLMASVPVTRRVRRMLDALPGSRDHGDDRPGGGEQWRVGGARRRSRRRTDDAAPKRVPGGVRGTGRRGAGARRRTVTAALRCNPIGGFGLLLIAPPVSGLRDDAGCTRSDCRCVPSRCCRASPTRRASTTCRSPRREPGTLLVRALALGVCGTDREIVSGAYGAAPPGKQRLILGHESLGIVEEAPPSERLRGGRPRRRHRAAARSRALPCLRGRRMGHVPQRPLHRARHQGTARLRRRALSA